MYAPNGVRFGTVLIETQWNVKVSPLAAPIATDAVLIETQWNVKQADAGMIWSFDAVLIETQWNVKQGCLIPYTLQNLV